MQVIKRDGRKVEFSKEKITHAVFRAAQSVGGSDIVQAENIALQIYTTLLSKEQEAFEVEFIQDLVEKTLIELGHAKTAKAYILYRQKRTDARDSRSVENKIIHDLVFSDAEDVDEKRENANIDGNSTMGAMLKIGGTVAKEFNLRTMIKPKFAQMHRDGKVHQHDLDFMSLCVNCVQIPLGRLLENGFNTGHGSLRPPATIGSAATLMCIIIQSSQNDFFGGQGIPTLDYDLAPFVAKSFVRNCATFLELMEVHPHIGCSNFKEGITEYSNFDRDFIKQNFIRPLDEYISDVKRIMDENGIKQVKRMFVNLFEIKHNEETNSHMHCASPVKRTIDKEFEKMIRYATLKTDRDTYQAMEATIHNLCTLNSRAGGQVPFSSVNTGTDTSDEGRMVTRNLFKATDAGLGSGETAIFPISIMKMKKGITDKGSKNYDLFQLACKTSAKRLFPNFVNLDADFNLQFYKEGHPETEVATMGCRTRVIGNVVDPNKAITPGRGNLFPITINLPYIALEVMEHLNHIHSGFPDDPIDSFENRFNDFINALDARMDDVFEMLDDRFEVVAKRKAKNYPFAMGQHIYLDSELLNPDDEIREAIKHGTLVTGFIGLAETLKVLFGKHHGESEESQKRGLEIISHMNERVSQRAKEKTINYSFMAAPAEGCTGRFLQLTRKRFGVIEGVTDHEYFTNSFHVPVYYPISAYEKVKIEAPYHALCPAGHISYIELDSKAADNLEAFEALITFMAENNMGYFSINHPVDRDPICGYIGQIGDVCPRCGRREGEGVPAYKLMELLAYQPDPRYAVRASMFTEEEDTLPNPIH